MRVIKTLHFGGTTIRLIDPHDTYPQSRMMLFEVDSAKIHYTLELTTECMDDLRHALRQASKITRSLERQQGLRG